jgi:acetate kinase
MTDALLRPHVLALNRGSSALKFGLYRVGSSQVDTLISGEAEAIDQGESRFRAQDPRRNVQLSKSISMPDLRDVVLVPASQEDEQIVRPTGALFASLLTRFEGQKSRTGR